MCRSISRRSISHALILDLTPLVALTDLPQKPLYHLDIALSYLERCAIGPILMKTSEIHVYPYLNEFAAAYKEEIQNRISRSSNCFHSLPPWRGSARITQLACKYESFQCFATNTIWFRLFSGFGFTFVLNLRPGNGLLVASSLSVSTNYI